MVASECSLRDVVLSTTSEAYVDTSAFIAFLDRSDSFHPLFRRLFSTPPRLVTSALVVAEGHGWFLRRYDARRGAGFWLSSTRTASSSMLTV